jgi:hypothetical protein
MKRLFVGALLLAFTSLAACSNNSESNQTRDPNGEVPGTYGTTTEDVPASADDPSRAVETLDTVVVDTNVRGNP